MSPVRVAEAGLWWDRPLTDTAVDAEGVAGLERRLAELDGQRLLLQRQAREQLTAEGVPVFAGRFAGQVHQVALRRTAAAATSPPTVVLARQLPIAALAVETAR
jgi:hypothetical protein